MPPIKLSITFLGSLARQALAESKAATILGVTSRGIFLKASPLRVLFLSYESYRGPLTINIKQETPYPIRVNSESKVVIDEEGLFFPESNLLITPKNANDWNIPAAPQGLLSPVDRENRIRVVVSEVIRQRGGAGLLPYLAGLLGMDLPPSSATDGGPHHPIEIDSLKGILQRTEISSIISLFTPFLGRGYGLTPSGDDMIMGFLLTCSRYFNLLKPEYDFLALRTALAELAYQKTSLLSANLIECAGQGQADERLVLALDGMLGGTVDPASSANLLLRWGSSSGCDALLGIVLAAWRFS